MIISPPFLPPRAANTSDQAYLQAAMPEQATGHYPVSNKLAWHGGLHLSAPTRGNGREPVRAIADGTVVYVRQPTARPADAAARDAHALGYNGWTDDGCVVIRHDTEIGANDRDQGVEVRFFSIYMHLGTIRSTVRANQTILRKAELGDAGVFEGSANSLHFEIICDDANLARLIGRSAGMVNINTNGRTDVVFGEMYFRIPVGTSTYAARPALNLTQGQNPTALTEELFVGIRYQRGNALVTSYRANGTTLPALPAEQDAEYNLYGDSSHIVQSYRRANAAVIPAHSAVYELLRFGRVFGPDPLLPSDVPHWRSIQTPTGPRWVNLNEAGIHKFSDGDAPHWAGWHLMEDTTGNDSRCDISTLRKLLDGNGDGITTSDEAQASLNLPNIRNYLQRLICKFHTEWHRGSIANRWQWLKQEGPSGPAMQSKNLSSDTYLTTESFPEFQRYAEALCFWEEANVGIPMIHWHFDPREFIRLYKNCLWLTPNDLERIYPETPMAVRERYRPAINKILRKYLISGNTDRSSHFFGQGSIETMNLQVMVEGPVAWTRGTNHPSFADESNGFYSDPTDLYERFHFYERTNNDLGNVDKSSLRTAAGVPLPVVLGRDSRGRKIVTSPTPAQVSATNSTTGDGMKFRGRGFKQLTGRANYADYWVYRGWLTPGHDFDEHWWSGASRRPAPIPDPQRISVNPYNAIDSGAQFYTKHTIARPADHGVNRASSDTISRIINRWDARTFPLRYAGALSAFSVLGDSP